MFKFITIAIIITFMYIILASLMKAADKPIPTIKDIKINKDK